MSYENAKRGISKVFTSEILSIISSVCMVLAAVCAILTVPVIMSGSEAGAGVTFILFVVLFIASFIIALIGYITGLVGLNTAGKDSARIANAFKFAIINLILGVVGSLFAPASSVSGATSMIHQIVPSIPDVSWMGPVNGVIQLAMSVFSLVIIYNVLFGCAELKSELQDKANSTWKVIAAVIIINIIVAIVSILMSTGIFGVGMSTTFFVITGILLVADFVLDVVSFIMYLVFLNKAKKVL